MFKFQIYKTEQMKTEPSVSLYNVKFKRKQQVMLRNMT